MFTRKHIALKHIRTEPITNASVVVAVKASMQLTPHISVSKIENKCFMIIFLRVNNKSLVI